MRAHASKKPCQDDRALDATLTELEDRGLLGWDRRANRYDLHPIVRGVVWSGLGTDARRGVYTNLNAHFEALPMIDDFLKVTRLEDLTPAIELYSTLLGLGRFEDAARLFYERIGRATTYRLSATRQQVELLEMLFPEGTDRLPRIRDPRARPAILNSLAMAYSASGQPTHAARLYRRAIAIVPERKRGSQVSVGLRNLSVALRFSGELCSAEAAAYDALVLTRLENDREKEPISLYLAGLTLAARGMPSESVSALQRSLRMFVGQSEKQFEGHVTSHLAERALWWGEFPEARTFANSSWELAHHLKLERDFIRAARVQGAAALGLHDFAIADERLHHALTRARQVNLVEEEIPALIALAELRRRQGKADEARELLLDVWDAAERGPYPLFHADACNVLTQLERDAGNLDQAIAAATQAYRLAWCDGPPFAYHWGLVAAQQHLREVGAPEPEMPPFDASKFEPMPEVEIDPDDEFHAGTDDDSR